jgi:hypothetical protein
MATSLTTMRPFWSSPSDAIRSPTGNPGGRCTAFQENTGTTPASKVKGGRSPGSRRASIVFPYPGVIGHADLAGDDGPDFLEIVDVHEPRAETGSQWAARLQPDAPFCACGCGEQIRLRPQHRCPTKGTPRFIQGHHPNPLRLLHAAVHAKKLLLTGDVCKKLRISESRYHRLEKCGVFPSPTRWRRPPRPRLRVFTPEDVDRLRTALRKWRRRRR